MAGCAGCGRLGVAPTHAQEPDSIHTGHAGGAPHPAKRGKPVRCAPYIAIALCLWSAQLLLPWPHLSTAAVPACAGLGSWLLSWWSQVILPVWLSLCRCRPPLSFCGCRPLPDMKRSGTNRSCRRNGFAFTIVWRRCVPLVVMGPAGRHVPLAGASEAVPTNPRPA